MIPSKSPSLLCLSVGPLVEAVGSLILFYLDDCYLPDPHHLLLALKHHLVEPPASPLAFTSGLLWRRLFTAMTALRKCLLWSHHSALVPIDPPASPYCKT